MTGRNKSPADRQALARMLRDAGRRNLHAFPQEATVEALVRRHGFDPTTLDDRQIAMILGRELDDLAEWVSAGVLE